MKRLLVVFFFGLMMVFSSAVFADEGTCGCGRMGKMEHGMKGGGMMGHGGMCGGHTMGEGESKGGGIMDELMDDHHQMVRMIMTSLGLDEKQKGTIKEIKHRVKKELIRKKADKEIARIELRELAGNDPMDVTAVQVKLEQIEGIRNDILIMLIRAKEEVKSVLTAEQKKKLKEMKEKRHTMRGMGEGMMHGGMGRGMMGGMKCCMMEGGAEGSGGKAEETKPSAPAHKH